MDPLKKGIAAQHPLGIAAGGDNRGIVADA
jgi:hypothetical protein